MSLKPSRFTLVGAASFSTASKSPSRSKSRSTSTTEAAWTVDKPARSSENRKQAV